MLLHITKASIVRNIAQLSPGQLSVEEGEGKMTKTPNEKVTTVQ